MLYKVQGYGEGCREKSTGIWGKGKRYRDMGKGALE
jgi:hypothetical protein